MSLEDLNERLHGRDAHLDRSRLIPQDEHSQEKIAEEQAAFQKADSWESSHPSTQNDLILVGFKEDRRRRLLKRFLFAMAGLAVVGGLGLAGYTFFQRESAVAVSIDGPRDVASAEPVSFTVTYGNESWSGIEDASLVFTLPEAFRPDPSSELTVTGRTAEVKVGDLAAGSAGRFLLPGKFFGSKGEKMNLEVTLRYTPQATASYFETKAALPITIATSPLHFEIEAPSEMVSGQEFDYVIRYENRGNEPLNNLRVHLSYPVGYQFIFAEPRATEADHSWYIPALAPKQSGKIVIRGILSGNRDEFKRIQGEIGIRQGDNTLLVYSDAERPTKMIASPLSITQTVNGQTNPTVFPGELLNYSIKFKNNAEVGVRDVVVTQSIDTSYLDVTKLNLMHGAYDDATKKITWRASDARELTQLAPGQEGEFTFAIPVLQSFSIPKGASTNIAVRSVATIDSPDIPAIISGNKLVGSHTLFVKLGALVSFDMLAVYTDPNIPNSGPVPPIAGQETTYTLRLRLENSSNDLSQARATIALPSGVSYKGKFFPGDAAVALNNRTNELTWEIGTLSPGAPRDLSIQVGVNPNSSHINHSLDLVKRAYFVAKDTYTNKEIKLEKGTLNNNLSDAETGPQRNGIVRGQ